MQNNTVTRTIRRLMVGAALVALSGGAFTSAADAGEMEVIEAGKLIVAFNGDMPGTGFQDGRRR